MKRTFCYCRLRFRSWVRVQALGFEVRFGFCRGSGATLQALHGRSRRSNGNDVQSLVPASLQNIDSPSHLRCSVETADISERNAKICSFVCLFVCLIDAA